MSDEQQKNSGPVIQPSQPDMPVPAVNPNEASGSRDELAAAKKQAEEYLNGWKRAMADYANLQKEVGRFKDEFAQFACAGLIQEFLPVLDNFLKAAAAEPPPEAEAVAVRRWAAGLMQVRQQFEAALRKAGVEPITAADAPFDPALHDALLTQKKNGVPTGQVIEVVTPGYRLNGKVIRPAKVIVAE